MSNSEDTIMESLINDAQRCMEEIRISSDSRRRESLKRKFHNLLNQAEKLKVEQHFIASTCHEETSVKCSTFGQTPKSEPPLSTRTLSTREKIILLEGSKLYGAVFPPWNTAPCVTDFEPDADGTLFEDDTKLKLSDMQLKIFSGWQRPQSAFPLPCLQQPAVFPDCKPIMTAHDKIDLVQDVINDCSLVASLCAITARAERGHSQILYSTIFPFNFQLQQPELASNGKYVFRFYFNGCFRKVIIDDYLPTSRTEQTLHVFDRNNPGLLWPALVEKAYLRIRGGYDFPGSNSGSDIMVLTSWIPEQLFLQGEDAVHATLWSRIFNAFNRGDVLVTIGTGKMSRTEEENVGLIGEHDYAVTDMRNFGGKNQLLIKNPWSEGTIWKGRQDYYSIFKDNVNDQSYRAAESEKSQITGTECLMPGTFWMDLYDVTQNFESMYLNWDPTLFSFRNDFHFTWDLATSQKPSDSVVNNPQFAIDIENGDEAWILLSRHLKTVVSTPHSHLHSLSLAGAADQGFISLCAFDNDGQRVYLNDNAIFHGEYVDSPNTLMKLGSPCKKTYTITASQQKLSRSRHNFTISLFSHYPSKISKVQDKYRLNTVKKGAWTPSSAGGNASSEIYHKNPQYSIQLSALSDVFILLETLGSNFPVHIKLIWGGGNLISSITTRDIVGDSGEYTNGHASAEISSVQPGTYTIVCSTFERNQLAEFTLRISTTVDCVVERINTTDAGRFNLSVPTACFLHGHNRVIASLVPHRITQILLEAQPRRNPLGPMRGSGSPLKIAIEYGQGPDKQTITVSGNDEFTDSYAGVRTGKVDINPCMCKQRGLWVVIERLGGLDPADEAVDLSILSDRPVDVGTWITRDG